MNLLSLRDQAAIWHPFTQHYISPTQLPFVKGEGAYLFDQEGKRYLDLISSWWVNIHGHANPVIAKAIYEQALQLEHVVFAGFTHEPAIALGEQLLKLLPGFGKVFYSDNGSTSIEVAIKMAYQYWQNRGEKKSRFLAFEGGYHGDTMGSMSLGRSSHYFRVFEDLLFSVDIAPFPATWQEDGNIFEKEHQALATIENYFKNYCKELAAIIIEPLIQGASGMRICRSEFLRGLESLAKQYGVLVIYDEVMTGFGRTGELFACKKAGTQPDIICLAKGITGGFLPLAVTICQEYIYQGFLSNNIQQALTHGHSYTANPLGCAAGLASLQLLLKPETDKKIKTIANVHTAGLLSLKKIPIVEKIRQCGTIAAFDIATPISYGSAESQRIREQFLEYGLLIRPLGNVIYLLPPYCTEIADLESAYKAITEILTQSLEAA
ncbi:MAG TPA: adenosylmethionine--8-amino-7-oxononanoate transaminase [Gammaproteobacteria bacterium]|nr:adenosylmethionine--8-amino-7-oxononanoate transaminase [Gammaproteobacteria bacterium]